MMKVHLAAAEQAFQSHAWSRNLASQSCRRLLSGLRSLFTFSASSLISAGVDFVLLMQLHSWLGWLLPAVVLARLASAALNFLLNRSLVFQSPRKPAAVCSLRRYALLAVIILALNYLLLHALSETLGLPLATAKLLTEAALWLFSFWSQKRFVFAPVRT